MPLTHEQRVANGKKAAETRRHNKMRSGHSFGPVPSYNAKSEQRHNRKEKPPKARKLISLRGIRKADTATLRADFEYMNRPRSETGLANTSANEKRYYAIKDELRLRENPHLSLYMNRAGYREIGGRKTKKSQVKRVTGRTSNTSKRGRKRTGGFFGRTTDSVSPSRRV